MCFHKYLFTHIIFLWYLLTQASLLIVLHKVLCVPSQNKTSEQPFKQPSKVNPWQLLPSIIATNFADRHRKSSIFVHVWRYWCCLYLPNAYFISVKLLSLPTHFSTLASCIGAWHRLCTTLTCWNFKTKPTGAEKNKDVI